MTARVSQEALHILVNEFGKPRVNQVAIQVLWGTQSVAQVSQMAMQVLGRHPVRRIVAISD